MKKSLLFMLLIALMMPAAMNGQGLVSASDNNNLQAFAAEGQQSIEMLRNREAGWLEYEGDYTGLYGLGGSTWTIGTMFPNSMLDDNNTVSAVAFVQSPYMTGDVIVNVYSGGETAPSSLIHTETVAVTSDTTLVWRTVDLTEAEVNFDPAANLWITLTITGTYIFPVITANEPNATWIAYNNNWYYASDLIQGWDASWGWMMAAYVDYTSIACATPTNLTVSDITTNSATLSWSSIGEETAYQVVYGEEGFNPNSATPIDVEARTYTLTGLTDDMDYEAYVRSNCGDGSYSSWSEVARFTTAWLCDKPFNLETSDITYHSANLSWDGWQDTYTVKYTPITKTWEADFSNGIPEGWNTIDNDNDGNNWTSGNGFVYSASYDNDAGPLTPDNWLVTPKIAMGGKLYITAYGMDPEYSAEHFGIYYSTRSNSSPARFTQIGTDFIATGEPTVYVIDLSSYSGEAYIAIVHHNCTDQFVLVVSEMFIGSAGETITVENETSPYAMEDLTEETFYAVQVQGNCSDDETDWSDIHYFTSGTGNVFQTAGDWNVDSNWKNNVVPANGEDVTINVACTIPANYTAIAGNVTIGEGGSLTIENNGQLIHTNEGVVATVKKSIRPYEDEKDNYYLLSSPVYDEETYSYYYNYGYDFRVAYPMDITHLIENNYDLYSFDFTEDLEWRNYKADPDNFVMYKGEGYLYANSAKTTLEFTGVLNPVPEEGYVSFIQGAYLNYVEDAEGYDFPNWNLVGNPHPCEVEILTCNYESSLTLVSEDFYRMSGDEIIPASGVVAPMEGVFVISQGSKNIAVSQLPSSSKSQSLKINVSNDNDIVDVARIRFEEGNGMPKIQLNPNHTKLFFTKDNKDYAVVNTEKQGEMPVNFKAENNGTYTLSFSTENVEFGYLHLIDNLTGNDVDLLATPSYTFNAKVTDYANRFKLVFNANNVNENNSNDSFAFYNNGNIIVNGNGTLNVVDMLGRRVLTQELSALSSQLSAANLPAGVYMLQLVNGDNVKTQKVVVK